MLDEIEADAADQFELDFMYAYAAEWQNVFPCEGPFANQQALEAEYYNASCSQICEVGEPPVWKFYNCGSGCCVKTNRYCVNENGGVTRGPSMYRQEEGLCDQQISCRTPVFDCYSRGCSER